MAAKYLLVLLVAAAICGAVQGCAFARGLAKPDHHSRRSLLKADKGEAISQEIEQGHKEARKKGGKKLLRKLDNNIYPGSAKNCFKSVLREELSRITRSNPDIAATLLRLFFHDAGAGGLNGSIMKFQEEQTNPANLNLDPGYPVIQAMQDKVRSACNAEPTYADTITYAATLSVELSGGPEIDCKLGRRDKPTDLGPDDPFLLPFFKEDTETLIDDFGKLGLDARDMVLLSAAHTIGKASCFTFNARFGGADPTLDPAYSADLQSQCAPGSFTRVVLDPDTSRTFDNNYFKLLQAHKGLLVTDQGLFTSSLTSSIVDEWVSAISSRWPIAQMVALLLCMVPFKILADVGLCAVALRYAGNNKAFLKDFEKSLCKMSLVGANMF